MAIWAASPLATTGALGSVDSRSSERLARSSPWLATATCCSWALSWENAAR